MVISSDQTICTVKVEWAGESFSIDLDNQESLSIGGLNVSKMFAIICSVIGNVSTLKKLVSFGIDPNAIGRKKCTALHYSIKFQQTEVIKFLLEIGAKTDIQTEAYELPTHYALKTDNLVALQLLLKTGADPKSFDKAGKTILTKATETNNLAALALLSQYYQSTLNFNKIFGKIINGKRF